MRENLQKEINEQLAIARKRLPHMCMTEVIDYVIETAYGPYEKGNGGRRNVDVHRKTSDQDLLKALKRHNNATKPKPIKINLSFNEVEALWQFAIDFRDHGPYNIIIDNSSGIGQAITVESSNKRTSDITDYDKW